MKRSLKTTPKFLPENFLLLVMTILQYCSSTEHRYIEKKVENTHFIENHTACTRGDLSLNPCLLLHLTGISLISWVLLLANRKNNDAAILNKHLSKKQCNNIFKWSQSNDVLVLDRGFLDSLDLIDSSNLRSESPSFLGKGQSSIQKLKRTHQDSLQRSDGPLSQRTGD